MFSLGGIFSGSLDVGLTGRGFRLNSSLLMMWRERPERKAA